MGISLKPPAPARRRPWVMRMRWVDLLFAHWPVAPEALGHVVPAPFELDLFDGRAWLGIVPFRMEDVAPRGLPAVPWLGAFRELNVRTYVRHRGVPGVWFLSLDAERRLAVEGARRAFHLPYLLAEQELRRDGDVVAYRSRRCDARAPEASFEARYRPTGPVAPADPLTAFLTDRPRLFSVASDGRVLRTEVRHAPWPLQPAEAAIRVETMSAAHGIALPDEPPHLRYAARLDVVAWWPRPA